MQPAALTGNNIGGMQQAALVVVHRCLVFFMPLSTTLDANQSGVMQLKV
jgi:hypothetical protein